MTAEHTNRMVQSANLPEIVDINGKAVLGGELAERVHRVDEGSEECESQSRIQQTYFYCEEGHQRSGNTMGDVPSST